MNKQMLSEDVFYKTKKINENATYNEQIYNESLILLEDECIKISNKTLKDFGITSPKRNLNYHQNRDYLRETSYNIEKLRQYLENNKQKLNTNQQLIFHKIMQVISDKKGGIYFMDAPGGTGKTFLLNLILAEIRAKKGIALAVASSGIASTLLEGGRTAHSMFKLPFNLSQTEQPTCNIKQNSSN